jgi:3'-5' exoribonuclease
MLSEIKELLSAMKNPHLKKLTEAFLEDHTFMKSFTKAPAAMQYHQNYVSGLLEHTLNTMKIGLSLCDVHPGLDRDLVAAGAFLHDTGKTREIGITGAVIDVTEDGMMLGHIALGYGMVERRICEIHDFPKELRLKVLHIMLSHHGLMEHGSPKKPQLPEAFAVYHADSADAEIDLYLRLRRDANTEDPWLWVNNKIGHVYLK